MKIIFDDLASKEYNDAIDYYELQLVGLGIRFNEEVKRALRNIHKYPEIGSIEDNDVRRYFLHKFPYKILYSIEANYIYIIAIAHTHREPTYWLKRIITKTYK